MPNHVHIVATPESIHSLELTFRPVHSVYAEEFNAKYGFSGYLWQSRYYSCPMDEPHFFAAVRYVERNPVRAGLVTSCEDYTWSSARAHCRSEPDPLLDENPGVLSAIPDWAAWLAQPNSGEIDSRIRKNTMSGYPCGSEEFVKDAERVTGRILQPKKRGRKKLQVDESQPKLWRDVSGSG